MKIHIRCYADGPQELLVRLDKDGALAKLKLLIDAGSLQKAIVLALEEGEILEKAAGNALLESDASLILTETSAHRCLM